MTDEQKREIRLSISEQELIQLLEALSVTNLTKLAVKINTAWLDEPKTEEALLTEGLQTIRDRLFRLKGYLRAVGYPREALSWVEEAIEVVKTLQDEEV